MSIATAHPNIALIKYWGKHDETLILPSTDSIALTLDAFETRTRVIRTASLKEDVVKINGALQTGTSKDRVITVLDRVRELAGSTLKCEVDSYNTVPTAAGLASSASGFAALAVAAANEYGLDLSKKDLSRLARLGSGSASRSIFGSFSKWNAGTSDESSFAEPIEWVGDPLAMVIAVISEQPKPISSRAAMRATAQTSPFYEGWVQNNNFLAAEALNAISQKNLRRLGELTELSTMRMHAVMLSADPAIRYLTPESFAVLDGVAGLREMGLPAYATADAGPNIKILTTIDALDDLTTALEKKFLETKFIRSGVGMGARLIDE